MPLDRHPVFDGSLLISDRREVPAQYGVPSLREFTASPFHSSPASRALRSESSTSRSVFGLCRWSDGNPGVPGRVGCHRSPYGALTFTSRDPTCMDGFLDRFSPPRRKMRSIRSRWQMCKPTQRKPRQVHEGKRKSQGEEKERFHQHPSRLVRGKRFVLEGAGPCAWGYMAVLAGRERPFVEVATPGR